MLQNRANRMPKFCLGELLLQSGAVSPFGLKDCALIAKKSNSPIGRTLVMTGQISELDLENALKTQRAIRSCAISEYLAKQFLHIAHSNQVSIEDAYRFSAIKINSNSLSRLAKLVLAAGAVDEYGMKQAIEYSETTCYPIGQSLVQLGYISEATLLNCFNLQVLIRDSHLSFYDAVRALRGIEQDGRTFESLLVALGVREEGVVTETPRLGELLVAANLITREESLVLAELGIENDVQYGRLLIDYNLVPSYVVDAAVQLQQMFANPKLSFNQAARVLSMVRATESSLEQVLEQIDSIRLAVRMLQSADAKGDAKLIVDDSNFENSLVNDFDITIAEAILVNHIDPLSPPQNAVFASEHTEDTDAGTSFTETVSRIVEIRTAIDNRQVLQRIVRAA
jgi:hypothetical protein